MKHISEELNEVQQEAEEMCLRMTGDTSENWRLRKDIEFMNACRNGLINRSMVFTQEQIDGRNGFSRRFGFMCDDVETVDVKPEETKLTEKETALWIKGELKGVMRYRIAKRFFARASANVEAYNS